MKNEMPFPKVRFWCGREELHLQGIAPAATSRLCVCCFATSALFCLNDFRLLARFARCLAAQIVKLGAADFGRLDHFKFFHGRSV